MFRACLPPIAVPFAALVRQLKPCYFREDFLAIRYCGRATSFQALRSEIDSFAQDCRDQGGFFRRTLKFRISCRRLMDLARHLLPAKSA